jgi:hypothetical protein
MYNFSKFDFRITKYLNKLNISLNLNGDTLSTIELTLNNVHLALSN